MKVLDTNIVIYLLEGRLAEPIGDNDLSISIITEIELLSHARLEPAAIASIRAFISDVRVVPLTTEIKESAIQLRREHGLTIPDAIIVATATTTKVELLTNDSKLISAIGTLCRALEIR